MNDDWRLVEGRLGVKIDAGRIVSDENEKSVLMCQEKVLNLHPINGFRTIALGAEYIHPRG